MGFEEAKKYITEISNKYFGHQFKQGEWCVDGPNWTAFGQMTREEIFQLGIALARWAYGIGNDDGE